VLVATGIMSVAWMLLLTLAVFVEKLLPRGSRFAGALGIVLMALGIVVSLGVIEMPWMSG
jgi:predicted metal-binding membrane protein